MTTRRTWRRRWRSWAAELGAALRALDDRLLPPVGSLLSRAVRGTRGGLLTFVAVVVGTALSVFAVYVVSPSFSSGAEDEIGPVTRVGVPSGDPVSAYVARTRSVLSLVPDGGPDRYALVSFTAYLAPDRLAPVLAPVTVSSVFTHVRLPGVRTDLLRLGAYQIPQDVVAAMDLTAQNKDASAANLTRMRQLATGRDDALAQVYGAGALATSEEATAYRQHCSCVYAAVVRGTPAALRRLGGRSEVRAVDLVPAPTRLDRTVFLPPLPEETGVASAVQYEVTNISWAHRRVEAEDGFEEWSEKRSIRSLVYQGRPRVGGGRDAV